MKTASAAEASARHDIAPIRSHQSMSSIRSFKTFLAVVRHGSFTAAGREVGLTPAAVGLQMRSLEQSLEQALFDRGPRSVVLNTAGRAMAPRIEQLVLLYDSLVAEADPDALSGTVVVGALVSALMGAFADALRAVKRQHPRLKVKILAGLSSDFADRVERGELDAAVVTKSPRPLASSLRWTPLYTEAMVLIVPRRAQFALPDEPLDMLRQAPFIRFDRHTWTGHLVNEVLRRCDVSTSDEMELNSVEAMIEIVRQGFGVSIVPRLANVNWATDRSLRVLTLPGIDVQRHVGLIERASHTRMRFTEAIKQHHYTAVDAGKT
ncbi:Transcriptional regulator, LysR family [Thiomonas delicata]|uniref:Transcriptional regulator, LysR family n=2 Tax=Thiomonas delicata TaxID=364030 RepID=A0A238D273_THIDL|nr:Transcriptional regulator, LysR family [Thiomonas delicata]